MGHVRIAYLLTYPSVAARPRYTARAIALHILTLEVVITVPVIVCQTATTLELVVISKICKRNQIKK